MRSKLVLTLVCIWVCVNAYPTEYCWDIGKSTIGTVKLCDIRSRPMPFIYQLQVQLHRDYYWKGEAEVLTFYVNKDGTYPNKDCELAVPLPKLYKAGESIYFSEICRKFTPNLSSSHVIIFVFQNQSLTEELAIYLDPEAGNPNAEQSFHNDFEKEKNQKMFDLVKAERKGLKDKALALLKA